MEDTERNFTHLIGDAPRVHSQIALWMDVNCRPTPSGHVLEGVLLGVSETDRNLKLHILQAVSPGSRFRHVEAYKIH